MLYLLFYIVFPELSQETVEILLSTASLIQLHSVTKACCDFLEKQLDPCNCLGFALFAEQQSCMGLHKSALEYTYQHFMQVINTLFRNYFYLHRGCCGNCKCDGCRFNSHSGKWDYFHFLALSTKKSKCIVDFCHLTLNLSKKLWKVKNRWKKKWFILW